VTITPPPASARDRKRLSTMRRVQAAALDLFEARGFGDVTIEQIASVCEVSAPTVYRHFGTKEQLVLWDEYDPLLFSAVSERRRGQTQLDALIEALLGAIDEVYAADAERILRRARLIEREPTLRAANASALSNLRDGLAKALARSGACRDDFEAEVVAGAVAAVLEVAVRRWQRAGGDKPLAPIVQSALRRLRRLAGKG
jgi:AcrR family transcriptional regulator